MKLKLLSVLLLAGSALMAAPRVVVGFGVGGYVAPAPVVAYAAVPAYGYPVVAPYVWRGYAARPYVRPYWVAPRYVGRRYYRGYWRRW